MGVIGCGPTDHGAVRPQPQGAVKDCLRGLNRSVSPSSPYSPPAPRLPRVRARKWTNRFLGQVALLIAELFHKKGDFLEIVVFL